MEWLSKIKKCFEEQADQGVDQGVDQGDDHGVDQADDQGVDQGVGQGHDQGDGRSFKDQVDQGVPVSASGNKLKPPLPLFGPKPNCLDITSADVQEGN